MKSTYVAPLAALLAVATAGPIFGPRAAQSHNLPAYAPPAYGPPPPPAYGFPSSFVTGDAPTTTSYLSTAPSASITPSANSSLSSPVGFTNTSSVPFATGVTTTSLPLTAPFTITLTTVSSSSVYTTTFVPSGGSTGSPITGGSSGFMPTYTNSTSTSTVTSTSYVTVPSSSTLSPTFNSATRNGTYYTPSGTGYSPSSTLVSPITTSRNSTSRYSTGTVPTTTTYSYGTAPVPYSFSMILSTGVLSSATSREGSPVTAGNTTAPTATAVGTSILTYTYTSVTTVFPNITASSFITSSPSSTFNPTFNSESRLPGTGSTTSTVTNLETFPSIVPDPTSSYSSTHTPSSGFGTITTAPTLVPYATNTPYSYPMLTAYKNEGPGSYPAYDGSSRGSWFGRLFRLG